MQGVAEPGLVLPPGASPHDYAMRPSEAAAMDGAELVIWMGPGLTPWLARAVDTLASDAPSLPLLEVEGTTILEYRGGPAFDFHTGEDAHAHAGADPHAWLDPENAKLWLGAIADALAHARSRERGRLQGERRGRAGRDRRTLGRAIEKVGAGARQALHRVPRRLPLFRPPFRNRGGGGDRADRRRAAGPARISAVRELIARTGAACVFAEPQFPADLIATVIEDSGARAATLDPLGATLQPGPELYPRMMRHLATALRACLDPAA